MPRKKNPKRVQINKPSVNLGKNRSVRLRLDQEEVLIQLLEQLTDEQQKLLVEQDQEQLRHNIKLGRNAKKDVVSVPLIIRLGVDSMISKLVDMIEEDGAGQGG